MRFNPPPGWPSPPAGWTPPAGWKPDQNWPAPPPGWQLWLSDEPAQALDLRLSSTTIGEDVPPAPSSQAASPSTSASTVSPLTSGRRAHALPGAASEPPPADDRAALLARIEELEHQLASATPVAVGQRDGEIVELSDERVLQDAGIYRYHHPLENAALYRDRLQALQARIAAFVKGGQAVLGADMFTFDGSLAKGRRMMADLSKLMLRAYNAEADNCVRSLRSGNITTAKQRLERSVSAIHRLGTIMELRVNPDYHVLRVEELELTADFQMKVQEERERAREEREQLREQRRAEQELAAERERLDKERAHYFSALEGMRAAGDTDRAEEYARHLAEIDEAIKQNDYRIANIRAGYVYVISNVGAFGPGVLKVGLTRRLEPRDRVRELGDASVPFPYDVHALFFSDDAVTLEAELHRALDTRRVNCVNPRREFFFATPSEVRELLMQKVGGLLEFTEEPDAAQYFQSRGLWPADRDAGSGSAAIGQ